MNYFGGIEMKLFSGPEKTVIDERVVNEYYKAGHFSFVIIIFLILIDYMKISEKKERKSIENGTE